MSKADSIYLSLFLFLLFLGHTTSQLSLDQEAEILIRLKQHWQNPRSLNSWTVVNSSHCTWPGVGCTNGSVSQLNLGDKNITGTIPPFLSDLKNITFLNFSYNYIPGTFPVAALFNLSKLQFLDLSQNYFVGTIPDGIRSMAGLSYLNLCANNFSGNVPVSIGQLSELKYLRLHQNQIHGTFPAEIGNLSNLEVLYMSYNGFLPSRLPPSFTKMKKLKDLWISEANLVGEIPDMIREMEALEYLDLSLNALTGEIPRGLFMLKNLRVMYLYHNKLSGEIPRAVGALSLTNIDLSDNTLTGTIPDDFGKLQNLSLLILFSNQLSGEIPESIGRLPALKDLRVFSNNLSGTLPPELGQFSGLESFQVASNRLTGRLPEYLCRGGKLLGVIAFDNNLNGELPESLGNCTSLSMIRISNNSFSGKIPDSLWTSVMLSYLIVSNNMFAGELPNEMSRRLSILDISYNRFSGKIPAGLGSCRNLVQFSASSNSITGTIPQELTALPFLGFLLLDRNQLTGGIPSVIISWKSLTALNLTRNKLSGQIPENLSYLPYLSQLDLSENQFSGQIPSQITGGIPSVIISWKSLTALNLRQNKLSGQIPEKLSYLPYLFQLDLSENQFSGHIPTQIGLIGIRKFTFLNLSSNHLMGKIPYQFDSAAFANSFLNNPGLCARRSLLNVDVCNSKPDRLSKSTKFLAIVLSVVISVLVLILLLSFLIIRIRQKKRCGSVSNSAWNLTSFQRLNFTETNILPGLTENNLIGSGGSGKVYRVAINHSEDVVAVKRISNNGGLDQKFRKLFLAEVEVLSKIMHLNIVKLLCCVSNDNVMLLVYEYMVNRSLDLLLHMKKRSSANDSGSVHEIVFDWPKRMQVAVGAAKGLCYMHHDCSQPIVHRDIKSSNILLDSEFNAKIADFGLAKMLIKEGEPVSVSFMAGSFGYIAPEYAMRPRVNEKIDVYSFGVVLLELTTGKEANYGDENTGLAEWAWRFVQAGNSIVDALDEEVKQPCYINEMSRVFKLGLICTSYSPAHRPSMKKVLQILLPKQLDMAI